MQKRICMEKKRILALIALVAVFLLITGCAGVSRLESFISSGEFKSHAKIIDFMLFFVIFFALSYLGLSKVWGEGFGKPGAGKGAIVGLCFALGLALSFAIVSQTTFSVTTIYPIAKAMFFIVVWFLIWGLLNKPELFGGKDNWGGGGIGAKIVTFILSFIIAYLLFSIATHMICQMSENMDDPACKSDFFNALFTLIGRWFGIEDWASSGGGGLTGTGESWFGPSTGGGGGTPIGPSDGGPKAGKTQCSDGLDNDGDDLIDTADPDCSGASDDSEFTPEGEGGKEVEQPAGEPQGACRLDITFNHDSTDYTSGAPITDFVQKAKDAGFTKVTAYGFASEDGQEAYNSKLAKNRANKVVAELKAAGIKASSSGKGETHVFGTTTVDYGPNRRVVIVAESVSSFVPAPSPGSVYGCEKGKEGEPFDWTDLWPLLLLLIPLLLWLLGKRRGKKPNVAFKKKFIEDLRDIIRKKKDEWERVSAEVIKIPASKDITDTARIDAHAKEVLDHLEAELERLWQPLYTLALWYHKDLNEIHKSGKVMNINDGDVDLTYKILKEMMREHGQIHNMKVDEFYANALKAVKNLLHENYTLRYFNKFIQHQDEMKRDVEAFLKKERKLLKKLGGKDDLGTTKSVLAETTQTCIDLCMELLVKIEEVLERVKNTPEHASEQIALKMKVEEEFALANKLVLAVEHERRVFEEDWCPVIDNINVPAGQMEGHIHKYR